MKKYIGLSLMGIMLQFASANDAIMKDAYRNYDAKQKCYMGINKSEHGIDKFCMKLHANETVASDRFPDHFKTYYLAVGNNVEDSHVSAGNIGLIIEDNGEGYDNNLMAQEKYVSAGSSGYAPTDYKFNKIGFNSYGFFTETGYTGQGITQGGMLIIGDNDGKIFTAYIPSFFDNSGFTDDENELESIGATYKILKNNQQKIYPIEITFNGKYEGKTYHQKSYVLQFDEQKQKYIIPSGYPFADPDSNNEVVDLTINPAFQGKWVTEPVLCRYPTIEHDQQYILTVDYQGFDLSGWNFGYTGKIISASMNTETSLNADFEYSTYFESETSQGVGDIQFSIRDKNRLLLGDTQSGMLFMQCTRLQ